MLIHPNFNIWIRMSSQNPVILQKIDKNLSWLPSLSTFKHFMNKTLNALIETIKTPRVKYFNN